MPAILRVWDLVQNRPTCYTRNALVQCKVCAYCIQTECFILINEVFVQ